MPKLPTPPKASSTKKKPMPYRKGTARKAAAAKFSSRLKGGY